MAEFLSRRVNEESHPVNTLSRVIVEMTRGETTIMVTSRVHICTKIYITEDWFVITTATLVHEYSYSFEQEVEVVN